MSVWARGQPAARSSTRLGNRLPHRVLDRAVPDGTNRRSSADALAFYSPVKDLAAFRAAKARVQPGPGACQACVGVQVI